MNQAEIDEWFVDEACKDLEFWELSLGSLYKSRDQSESMSSELKRLIAVNIAVTYREILCIREMLNQ